jgi:LDH2 family malate/lactate/ureidoglycolate dehydrogenase
MHVSTPFNDEHLQLVDMATAAAAEGHCIAK